MGFFFKKKIAARRNFQSQARVALWFVQISSKANNIVNLFIFLEMLSKHLFLQLGFLIVDKM